MALRLGIVLLLTACACNAAPASPTPGPTISATATPEPLSLFPERELPEDASQWERLIARVGARGMPDKQAALDAFAIAFTPLPGTTEPEGEAAPVEDGTLAVAWIRHFWNELTAEQQDFAESIINGEVPQPLPSVVAQPFAAVGPFRIDKPPPLMALNDWQALANEMRTTTAARLSRDLQAQMTIKVLDSVMDVPLNLWDAGAWADIRDANGVWTGKPATCTIFIPPNVDYDPEFARALMAHEVFHCFDYDLGPIADHLGVPPWIQEGAATYAGLNLTAGAFSEPFGWIPTWAGWLTYPELPIYLRSYDAFGIFYLLQNTGPDPWGVMDQILVAARSGSIAAYKKMVELGGDWFLDTWGSRHFMYGAPSQGNFRYVGDGLETNAMFAQREAVPITPGESANWTAFPYAADAIMAGFNSDVVMLTTPGGHGYVLTTAGENTLEGTSGQVFCTLPAGCECLDQGAPDFDSVFVPFDSLMSIGMTGHELGESITVAGYDLDTFCAQQPKDPCKTGCAGSNGDPHLMTVDGHDYDFQAAGEYTLLRSADGSLEVQARQEAWRDSRDVSINTAVAVQLNDDRVAAYVEPTGTRLSVNGVDVPYSDATAAGALQIEAIPNGISFEAPDGTIVWVIGLGEWGLNIAVAPSGELRDSGVGLLGPAGGEGLLPALPDGSDVPVGDDVRTAIYDVLGPAWEVSPESSLFDYAAGQGPQNFHDPTMPQLGAPLNFDYLTFDQQVAGMRTCEAVDDLTLREQCAFDVTVTGDLGFVASYEQTEAALGPQASGPQPTDAGSPTPLPGADSCDALSSERITELTGFEVLSAQPGTSTGGTFTAGCHWTLDALEADTTWEVILNVQSPGGRSSFDTYVQFFPGLEHVPDVADDAVLDVGNSVIAVVGDTRLDVQYINLHDPNAEAVLIELARDIAAQF